MDDSTLPRGTSPTFDNRALVYGVCAALILYAFLLRIFSLDAKVNVDAIWMWHGHTLRFWRGLAAGRWTDTFMHHPGVSFMWLGGLSMKVSGVFGRPLSDAVLIAGKLPVVLISSLSVGATFLWLRRIFGSPFTLWAAIAAFLLASEPFAVGHSRTFHLDMLVTSFGWCAALAGVIAARERSRRWCIATGLLLGLAILSKLSAGAIAVGVAAVFIVETLRCEDKAARRKVLRGLLLVVGVSAATVVLLWPSLLFAPAKTAAMLWARVRGEFSAGHELFAWGRTYPRDPGVKFYWGVFLFRITPEVVLFSLLTMVAALRLRLRADTLKVGLAGAYPAAYVVLTHAVWLLVFLTNQKKQDRYLLTFFPLITLAAVFGVKKLLETQRAQTALARWGKRGTYALLAVLALVALGRTGRVIAAHPVPMGWTSTLPFLSAERGVQLGIGEGLREVAQFIKKDVPKGVTPTLSLWVYHRALSPWIRYKPVHYRESMYIIDYICLRQRKKEAKLLQRYTRGIEPLLVVRYGSVEYARLYPGPRHPSRRGER